MKNKSTANYILVITVLIVVAFCFTGCNNAEENGDFDKEIAVEKEYADLTTGGKNSPFEVRFGEVDPEERSEYKDRKLLIIDADFGSKEDIAKLHENGNKRVLVYINAGTLDTNFVTDNRFDDLKFDKYEDWPDEYWVDLRDDRWKEFIYEQALEVADLGADGFFVDNLDVYGNYPKDGMFEAILEILGKLASIKRDIVINGGDEFVTKAMELNLLDKEVFSVNQETVFTHINFEDRTCSFGLNKDSEYYIEYLNKCKRYGIPVYLLEYGRPEIAELKEIRDFCKKNVCTYWVSPNIDLDRRWKIK